MGRKIGRRGQRGNYSWDALHETNNNNDDDDDDDDDDDNNNNNNNNNKKGLLALLELAVLPSPAGLMTDCSQCSLLGLSRNVSLKGPPSVLGLLPHLVTMSV